MPRQTIEIDAVMEWLLEHHPELHKTAEADRQWLWLTENLSGEHNKPVRQSIKEFGFRFAPKGHVLPSGNTGTWAHSCLVPKRFAGGKPTVKPKQQAKPKPSPGGNRRIDPFSIQAGRDNTEMVEFEPVDQELAAGLAFFNS